MANRYLFLSIIIHSLSLLLYLGTEPTQSNRGNNPIDVQVISKPKNLSNDKTNIKDEDKNSPKIKKQINADVECPDDWYGGIGIKIKYQLEGGDIIEEVYEGYAADIYGIVAGDILIDQNDTDIRGEPGTNITLVLLRQGKEVVIDIIRGKVCYSK